MLTVLRHRQLRLYLGAQTMSGLGDASLWLAAAIWVVSLTGSAAAGGMVMFAFGISGFFGPAVGLLVDRVRRLPLLIAANAAGIVLVAPLLLVRGKQDIWLVYAVMFGYGMLNRVISSAQSALLATIVPDNLLASANGLIRSVQESMRIVVPLLGAGLFAWQGITAVVILDIVTFTAAVAVFAMMRPNEPKPERTPSARWHHELSAGFRHIRGQRLLKAVVAGATVAMLVFGFTEAGIFAVVTDGLGRTAAFVGVTGVAQGIGSILVSPFSGAIANRLGEIWLVAVGLLGFAVALLMLSVPSLPWVLAALLVAGMSLPLTFVGVLTSIQRYTPNNLQGRVFSTADTMWAAGSVTSIGLGAGLVTVIGYQAMFVIAAAVLVGAALIVLTGRGAVVRPEGEPTTTAAEPAAEPAEAAKSPERLAVAASS